MKFKTLTILSIFLFSNCATAQSDLIFKAGFEYLMQKLNDTGITWSGEYTSGNLTECTNPASNPSNQDCNTGRDFTHNDPTDGHAGFSFTKLDASGAAIDNQGDDYATTQWSCVQDNVTGLVWEVKTTLQVFTTKTIDTNGEVLQLLAWVIQMQGHIMMTGMSWSMGQIQTKASVVLQIGECLQLMS